MRTLVLHLAWVTSFACGGEPQGGILDPVEVPPAEAEASLESIQDLVFNPGCALAGCHSGESTSAGLDLSSQERSYETLVQVRAANPVAKENHWVRVKPFDPELSFLLRKLDQPGVGEGSPMPSADRQLSPFYRDLIVRWIEEGAQP